MLNSLDPGRRAVLLWGATGLMTAASAACTAVARTSSSAALPPVVSGSTPVSTPVSTPGPTLLAPRDPSTCTWREEFDGAAGAGPSAKRWTVQTGAGGWGNQELQAYTASPRNIAQDGASNLRITMLEEPVVDAQGRSAQYTSARIISKEPLLAGRLEARMNVPEGAGLWSAFWTLGEGYEQLGWPACGEIDVVEVFDDATGFDSVVHAAAPGTASGRWRSDTLLPTVPDGGIAGVWHTYAVDITDGELLFSVDDVVHRKVSRDDAPAGADWPFDRPQHVLLDLAMARWGPASGHPSLPAALVVDWVRAYPRS